jgi:hypothetical protein
MSIRRYNAYYYREVTKNGEWAIRKLSPHNLRRIVITLFICLTSAGWVDLPYPSRKCWQKSSPSVSVLVERISIPFFHLPFVFDGRQTCKNHLLPKNSFTDFFFNENSRETIFYVQQLLNYAGISNQFFILECYKKCLNMFYVV